MSCARPRASSAARPRRACSCSGARTAPDAVVADHRRVVRPSPRRRRGRRRPWRSIAPEGSVDNSTTVTSLSSWRMAVAAASSQTRTLRMTSPSCMARIASFTSCRCIVRVTIEPTSSRPLLDEADEAREVAAHLRGAVHAADGSSSLRARSSPGCAMSASSLGHADHHRRAAGARAVDRLADRAPRCRSPRTRSRRRARRSAARTASIGSPSVGSTTSVAPNFRAASRFMRDRVDGDDARRRRRCGPPGSRPGRPRRTR